MLIIDFKKNLYFTFHFIVEVWAQKKIFQLPKTYYNHKYYNRILFLKFNSIRIIKKKQITNNNIINNTDSKNISAKVVKKLKVNIK